MTEYKAYPGISSVAGHLDGGWVDKDGVQHVDLSVPDSDNMKVEDIDDKSFYILFHDSSLDKNDIVEALLKDGWEGLDFKGGNARTVFVNDDNSILYVLDKKVLVTR